MTKQDPNGERPSHTGALKRLAVFSRWFPAVTRTVNHDWEPFGLTDEESKQYQVLVPGVPEWMREPLIAWICEVIRQQNSLGGMRQWTLMDMQAEIRVDLGLNLGAELAGPLARRLREAAPMELLRVTDYIASRLWGTSELLDRLERILAASRSKWTVGDRRGRAGLVERLPEGVQSSVEGAIVSSGSAGKILARAWNQVHRLVPNASGAYADAVRAVEIAAIAVVQPKHSTATLGTVLGQMKADGDWRLDLREHADAPGAEMILSMGRTLWCGHRDRHGSVNYSDVTYKEARQAVALAATLVEWFSSGAVRRRQK